MIQLGTSAHHAVSAAFPHVCILSSSQEWDSSPLMASSAAPARFTRVPTTRPPPLAPCLVRPQSPSGTARGRRASAVLCVPRVLLEFIPVHFPCDTCVLLPHRPGRS